MIKPNWSKLTPSNSDEFVNQLFIQMEVGRENVKSFTVTYWDCPHCDMNNEVKSQCEFMIGGKTIDVCNCSYCDTNTNVEQDD